MIGALTKNLQLEYSHCTFTAAPLHSVAWRQHTAMFSFLF